MLVKFELLIVYNVNILNFYLVNKRIRLHLFCCYGAHFI